MLAVTSCYILGEIVIKQTKKSKKGEMAENESH